MPGSLLVVCIYKCFHVPLPKGLELKAHHRQTHTQATMSTKQAVNLYTWGCALFAAVSISTENNYHERY